MPTPKPSRTIDEAPVQPTALDYSGAGAIDRSTCVATLKWQGDTVFVPGPLACSVSTWEELQLTFTSTSFAASGILHVASTTIRPPAPNSVSNFSVTGQKL